MSDDDDVEATIASILDWPSVYMGGPSPGSRRRAKHLIESLRDAGYVIAKNKEKSE